VKTDSHFFVHVYGDKDCLTGIYTLGEYENKKDAKKAMMNQANNDLTYGCYYFYRIVEQKNITHETYPSTETTE
jgi:hypothetical protein